MSIKKTGKVEWLIVTVIFLVPAFGWLVSEIRWSRTNNPDGRFTTASEYLAHGRQPSRVTKVEKEGSIFLIAYSPMDTWLAVPSGPAAYVFDEHGQMVEWSRDTGDAPEFQRKWALPQEESSVAELRQVGLR